jgi:transaldolase
MATSRVQEIGRFGQSIWYDNISRAVIRRGVLARMVAEDGVSGVTSNPTIFMKAIAETADYDDDIRRLAAAGMDDHAIVRALMVGDIQEACDILRPVFDRTAGADGFVSLECDPHLSEDARGTVSQAVELAAAVGRPNLMIKVPGTAAGLPAVTEIISRGINVNVTLLFSPGHYQAQAEAFLAGLEKRAAAGQPVAGIASVASLFLSRIDTVVDARLREIAPTVVPGGDDPLCLLGKAAVATARSAYARYAELFGSGRFGAMASLGAARQRPLWASTGTKDPAYRDVKYVEELIGPDTVNTVPQATLDAFRDHGRAAAALVHGCGDDDRVLERLADFGIDMDLVWKTLQDDGVRAFVASYDALVRAVAGKRG